MPRLCASYLPVQSCIRIVLVMACFGLVSSCSTAPASSSAEGMTDPANRVASLQIVDCLLPGMVRRLGDTQYFTPRRPIKTTAADCNIRGGEYTAYDRADYKTALTVWMPAAQGGDADAQTNVGEIFERGLGGEPNYAAAAIWYEKAARQANTRAQFNLGTLYEQGLGVEKDQLRALNLYRQAWGMAEDDIVFQSMASAEVEALRKELGGAIDKREARINRLQQDLKDLQKEYEAQKAEGAAPVAVLETEIEDLTDWIDSLNAEQQETSAQLSGLAKMREPVALPTDSSSPRVASVAAPLSYKDMDFGRYFALIIGNQTYSKIGPLASPAQDAQEMAAVLRDKYGFEVQILLNADNIELMETINDLNERLDDSYSLLIYYAGHGSRVQANDSEYGYWLPVNADPPPRDTYWVANEFVTGHLDRLRARRVLVVADSCYAGLLSDTPGFVMLQDSPQYTDAFLRYKLPKRSRLLISSGGDQPVLDDGGSGHSVFAEVLLDTLKKNNDIIAAPQLFMEIQGQVVQKSAERGVKQEPEFKAIKGAGHEVGDFFFVPI